MWKPQLTTVDMGADLLEHGLQRMENQAGFASVL